MNKLRIRFMKRRKFRLIPRFGYCKFLASHNISDKIYRKMIELSVLWFGYGVALYIPRSGWLQDDPNDTFNFFDKTTWNQK